MPKMNSLNSEASIFAAQDVGGLQKEGLELGEGDFFLFHLLPPLTLPPLRSPFASRTPAGPSPSHMALFCILQKTSSGAQQFTPS